MIALPLQGLALKSGNSAFVDDNWNAYEDQLKVLAGTRRLTRQEIEDYLSLWYSAGSASEDDGNDTPWDKSGDLLIKSSNHLRKPFLYRKITVSLYSTLNPNLTQPQLASIPFVSTQLG